LLKVAVHTIVLLNLLGGIALGEGERISEILIKGNRRIETAAILNVVHLKAGDLLSNAKVDEDLRAIYKLGHFQDVRAEVTKSDKGIVLTYQIVEKPIVREVKFVGNKELTVDKLREACEVKVTAVYSPKDLSKSVNKIKKLYADEGYYLAEVTSSTERRAGADVAVVFTIKEGEKVLIKTIRFEGNRAFTDRKLKKVMETSEAWFLSWLTGSGTYKEDVAKNDVNLIADLYFNNGYINAKVGEPKVEILPDKSGLVLTFVITEGDQYKTGSIGFKGDLLESEGELVKKVKLKQGEVFSREVLRGDVFTLTDLYADKGYAFTNVTPLTALHPQEKTIDITFDFEKGTKVFIDRINISGNTKTRDKVVRRELKLAEGDLYGSTAIKKSKQNLMNLGFFEEVNIATAKGSADDRLNMNVEVKEKPTGTFSVGAGYSSLDGIIGQVSVQQANYLGLGLKANVAAGLGKKSQTYNLGLTDPYFMDTRWTLGSDIYRTERDYTDYKRRATGGDIKAGYPLSDTLSTFWIYKYEDKKIFDESLALLTEISTGLINAPETTSTTSSITASLTSNTTDYRLDPSRGMVNSVSVEYAGLGGTNHFVRTIGNSTVFFPFKWGTVFSLRGELGSIQGANISIDEKFYLGGIGTIRGYSSRTVSPYRLVTVSTSVGPLVNNVFTGGDAEAVFNVEYQFPLVKEAGLKGVAFFDIGNAYNHFGDMFSRFQSSYGLGVRWNSPMGPLRLEYGIPVNPRPGIDKAGGKVEFSMGTLF
jgi:outer membrane protein insertion porin family